MNYDIIGASDIVTWLLTISLVGIQNFAVPAISNEISQELQAPPQVDLSLGFPPVFIKAFNIFVQFY